MTAIERTAEKLVLAGFVQTSGDGYGVYPEREKLLAVLRDLGWEELEKAAVDVERYLGHTNPEAGARTNHERAIERLRAALAQLRWQEVERRK